MVGFSYCEAPFLSIREKSRSCNFCSIARYARFVSYIERIVTQEFPSVIPGSTHAKHGIVIKRRSSVDYYRFVPAQLSFRQYQRHENDIRPHPQCTEAKYDGGFGHTTGMTLEYLGGVGRDISGSADAESQISSDHRYR